jgi:hypothetical protein
MNMNILRRSGKWWKRSDVLKRRLENLKKDPEGMKELHSQPLNIELS